MIGTHPFEIVDVLGNRALITRRYGDGSFDCPHCHQPVVVPALECSHPWCPAHPRMPEAEAAQILAVRAEYVAEKERVRRNMRAAGERIEREAAERRERWAEVKTEVAERGACIRCAARTFERGGLGTKIVKHRKACPLEVKA